MNIKEIEKATKIVSEIKKLDAEIIKLDKMALFIAENGCEAEFILSIKKQTPKDKDVIIDEDGSLRSDLYDSSRYFLGSFIVAHGSRDKKESKESYNEKTSDICSLQLIGTLILDKKNKIKELMSKLTELGILTK